MTELGTDLAMKGPCWFDTSWVSSTTAPRPDGKVYSVGVELELRAARPSMAHKTRRSGEEGHPLLRAVSSFNAGENDVGE